ncbi:MAG: hypothetical protein HY718_07445 [Planctomycetes bacterium]|nr:hypothetical protein [Planctomycetota bacterium]
MTTTQIDVLLRRFHQHIRLIRLARGLLLGGTAVAVFWAASLAQPESKRMIFMVFMGTLVIWVLAMVSAARLARCVRTAATLVSIGQLDDAEVWLRRVLEGFSLSARAKILACQQFASLLFRRDAHAQVVQICTELLKERLSGLQQIWVTTRVMLADSLLMLDRVPDAYDAIRPIYDVPLSLADRMKLLPVQLRYELAADHAAAAAQGLPDKLRIAELLDSARAALVHALLAEACRRCNMPRQQAFLAERARLYHDLDQLAARYPVIAPIARGDASG